MASVYDDKITFEVVTRPTVYNEIRALLRQIANSDQGIKIRLNGAKKYRATLQSRLSTDCKKDGLHLTTQTIRPDELMVWAVKG